MIEAFLEALEAYLGVTHTKISIAEEWKRTGPETLRNEATLKDMVKFAYALNGYDNLGASGTVILVPHGRRGANYRDREPEKSGFDLPYPLSCLRSQLTTFNV